MARFSSGSLRMSAGIWLRGTRGLEEELDEVVPTKRFLGLDAVGLDGRDLWEEGRQAR